MNIEIVLENGLSTFQPGEEVVGQVSWSINPPPRHIAIQLLWMTRGKGIVDTQIVDSVTLESPAGDGRQPFRFRLPASPYSFTGSLVSVVWAIRAIAEPANLQAQVPIIVSPVKEDIRLSTPFA